jgi:hypothetical protein
MLTPWSRVLPEKLAGLQPVKKFPSFYGTRRLITTLTTACLLTTNIRMKNIHTFLLITNQKLTLRFV